MPEGQRHLTHPGRSRIHALMKSGLSGGAIARQLGRGPSSVPRGIRRNGGARGQRQARARRRSEARRRAASSVPSRMTPELWRMVEERLVRGWSPARVAGCLRKEGHPVAGRQWIYRHVHADRRAGGRLWRHLRRRARRPNRRGGAHAGRGHIPGRVDIPERPALVEGRERVGDREADKIVGADTGGAVVSLVERPLRSTLHDAASDLDALIAVPVASHPIEPALEVPATGIHGLVSHHHCIDVSGIPVYCRPQPTTPVQGARAAGGGLPRGPGLSGRQGSQEAESNDSNITTGQKDPQGHIDRGRARPAPGDRRRRQGIEGAAGGRTSCRSPTGTAPAAGGGTPTSPTFWAWAPRRAGGCADNA